MLKKLVAVLGGISFLLELHASASPWGAWAQAQSMLNSQSNESKDTKSKGKPLKITAPADRAQVPVRLSVEGTVAVPDTKVFVIVHPMEVSDYWVQPSVTVKSDGTWRVQIYVGRPGPIDIGKEYEILAVGNPKEKLSEGSVVGGWPDAEWKSEVIEVVRK